VTLTSLEFPHRSADAYLRDSTVDGVPFDHSEVGRALQAADLTNASSLFAYDPGSLVFGAWNSHRKGRQAKIPRIYSSELVGWHPQSGSRMAGWMDPFNLVGGCLEPCCSPTTWHFGAATARSTDAVGDGLVAGHRRGYGLTNAHPISGYWASLEQLSLPV